MNVLSGEFLRPRLEGDWLVTDREGRDKFVWQRIAANKSGLLVCSFSLPLGTESIAAKDQPVSVDPGEVAMLLADMVAFGWTFFESVNKGPLCFEWSLEDLSTRVRVSDQRRWTKPAFYTVLSCQPGVGRISYPEVTWAHRDRLSRSVVVSKLGEVVRELFFPFEGKSDEGQRCRLEPSASETDAAFNEFKPLRVFSAPAAKPSTKPAGKT